MHGKLYEHRNDLNDMATRTMQPAASIRFTVVVLVVMVMFLATVVLVNKRVSISRRKQGERVYSRVFSDSKDGDNAK